MNDLISRQEALDAFGLSEKTRKWGGDHSGYNTLMLYEIQDVLEALPSAYPKKGKWMLWSEPGNEHAYCSVCKAMFGQDELYIGGTDYPKYCPECGARMVNYHDTSHFF